MRDDGGSAFPQVGTEYVGGNGDYQQFVESAGGMTLRDYFAAKAMQALGPAQVNPYDTTAAIAKTAYAMADAMLKARQS